MKNRRTVSPTRKQGGDFYKKLFRGVRRGHIVNGHAENNFDLNSSVKVSHWRVINKRET